MNNAVNEHLVKISAGFIPIEHELKLGDDITLTVDATITKIEQRDNQDGTYNQVYVAKGVIAVKEDKCQKEAKDLLEI